MGVYLYRGGHENPCLKFDWLSSAILKQRPLLHFLVRIGLLLEHLQRQFADCVGHVFIGGQVAQVGNQQVFHQPQGHVEWGAGLPPGCEPHCSFYEAPLHGNLAQHGFQHVFLAGNLLHFPIRNFARVEHGQRDQFGAVANQDRPLLLTAFHGELDSAFHVEFGDLLQRAAALLCGWSGGSFFGGGDMRVAVAEPALVKRA